MKDVVAVLGGLLGAGAFFWNVVLAVISHNHIQLKAEWLVKDERSILTALATLENKGRFPKRIHYLVLAVGPVGESLHDMVVAVRGDLRQGSDSPSEHLREFARQRCDDEMYGEDGSHALIPIPFIYRDQPSIGQEVVSYRAIIDTTKIRNLPIVQLYLVAVSRYPLDVFRYRFTSEISLTDVA